MRYKKLIKLLPYGIDNKIYEEVVKKECLARCMRCIYRETERKLPVVFHLDSVHWIGPSRIYLNEV